ncbi:hypothetical protein ACWEFL_04330 [Streptomyces sp. NPDC004838]
MSGNQTNEDSGRRRRAPLVASVVAAVLVVGAGGAYFVTAGFGGDDGADAGSGARDAKLPLISVSGVPGDGPGVAPGELDPAGGTRYRAVGELPDGPDRAAVHHAEGRVTEGQVARLAKALGLPGPVRPAGSVWRAGADRDGSGETLRVNADAPGTWTYSRFGPSPRGDDCRKADVCASTATGSAPDAEPLLPPVSEAAAKRAAAPVLKALGQSDAALDAGQVMGGIRVVNAEPVVGGLPTHGWTTGIQVGADGQVVGGSGQLTKPRKGGEYPVVSADRALGMLSATAVDHGPARSSGCPPTDPADPALVAEKPCDVPVCATPVPVEKEKRKQLPRDLPGCVPVCPTAQPDDGVGRSTVCGPAEPQWMTVDRAVFGLAARYVDGKSSLVPSWLFRIAPGGGARPYTMAQPAVEPRFLTRSAGGATPAEPSSPSQPQPQPTRGTGPSRDPAVPDSDRRVQSYTADGRTLTVTFWGGVCSDYTARANESDGRVRVTITESEPRPGRVCIALAKELTEKVTLEKPLGGREVVDAQTGKTVPVG